MGLSQIDAVVAQLQYTIYDLDLYFKKCISYELTDAKREGLRLFLEKIKAYEKIGF
jgi:predicted solute-binding protein